MFIFAMIMRADAVACWDIIWVAGWEGVFMTVLYGRSRGQVLK